MTQKNHKIFLEPLRPDAVGSEITTNEFAAHTLRINNLSAKKSYCWLPRNRQIFYRQPLIYDGSEALQRTRSYGETKPATSNQAMHAVLSDRLFPIHATHVVHLDIADIERLLRSPLAFPCNAHYRIYIRFNCGEVTKFQYGAKCLCRRVLTAGFRCGVSCINYRATSVIKKPTCRSMCLCRPFSNFAWRLFLPSNLH